MPTPTRQRGEGAQSAYWRPDLAFHASLAGSWAAIAVLWSITPLCYLYVLWNLITISPTLAAGRPASHGALRIIHYIVLAYASLEIPFSIYYRYLAIKAQARRSNPQYTRKYLRDVFRRSLENGLQLDEEGAEDDPLEALALGELTKVTSREDISGGNVRKRRTNWFGGKGGKDASVGDGPATPETLHMASFAKAQEGAEKNQPGTSYESVETKRYAPSFIETPLEKDDPRAHDFREFLRIWFHHAKYEDIGRLNMCDWLAWSLYGQPYEELVAERAIWEKNGRPAAHLDGAPDTDEDGLTIDGDKLGLTEHCVDMVEARAGRPFPPGRNPDVKTIRLTLDPVRVWSRPLILYVFVWCLQKIIIANSTRHGFKEVKGGDLRYLVRIPEGWVPDRNGPESCRPLLFLHGLGMGMAQYATFLNYLSTSKTLKDRPLLVLIQPNISMSFFQKGYLSPLDSTTTATGLKSIAEKWGFDKSGMTVLSHSNGTMVHGWLLKAYPELCVRNCFVDPVCFCLWEVSKVSQSCELTPTNPKNPMQPYVAFNFLYSTAKSPIEYLMRYFVSRELGVALMLQRSFDWSSNLLFPHTIPNLQSPYHSAFFLAGKDSILNAERIRRYLIRHGVKQVPGDDTVGDEQGGLKVHALNKHGQSMIGTGGPFTEIISWVSRDQIEGDMASGNSSETP
ncbi:hypothetical protein P7C70_g1037, partial [Phenoliferia sp. Uapishka_3]